MTARRAVQMKLVAADRIGLLVDLLGELKQRDIELLAIAGWEQQGQAVLLLIPADANKLRELATEKGWQLEERPVIYFTGENVTGALVPVMEKLAGAGVNLVQGMAIGAGETYGAVLAVAEADYEKACELLGA